jgi:hypothetical protein
VPRLLAISKGLVEFSLPQPAKLTKTLQSYDTCGYLTFHIARQKSPASVSPAARCRAKKNVQKERYKMSVTMTSSFAGKSRGPEMKTRPTLIPIVLAALMITGAASEAKTIRFSGYDWTVKSGVTLGPGPNNWDENNVWVDDRGDLHLLLTTRDGQWYCSEVSLNDRLGFGRYQIFVIGRIDTLDPNVVLGLFNYPTPDVGPDGTNEIDIEFAKWSDPKAPIGNYTVWPTTTTKGPVSKRFPVHLTGTYTTHRFFWNSTSVFFQSLHGHYDDNTGQFGQWKYQPTNPLSYIPQNPMHIHLNLWLRHGQPPVNSQSVEVVVRSFTFTPTISW